MVFGLLSAFFLFLALRGIIRPLGPRRFDSFVAAMLVFAVLAALVPARQAWFEYRLARAVERLTGYPQVTVSCLSRLGGIFHYRAAGFMKWGTGDISLQPDICSDLRRYLSDPEAANQNATRDREPLFALHVLTHEAMHVAGIRNEKKTDCAAYQRNHRMAQYLDVPKLDAARSAIYVHRTRSPHHKGYFAAACEPGGGMDEKLSDAVWVGP